MTRLAIQNCLVGALIFCLLASCGETAEQPAVEWERTKEKEDKEPVVADRESAITDAEQSARREKLLRRATRSTPIGGEKQCLSPYFFVLSDDPDTDRLPLKSTRAEVDIAGVIARVKVVQTYSNEGRKTLEAVYIFPASTRAAVHAMRMKIGERVIEARIKEREKARADYENARREGKSASLLEQMRPNVFQMNVANILPGDEIKVELEYTELLRPEKGVYEFVYPSIVGPRYSKVGPQDVSAREAWVENPYLPEGQKPTYDFGLNAEVRTGIPLSKVMSPSHDIESSFLSKYRARVVLGNSKLSGNRDFVLHYSLAGERIQSGLLLYPGQEENFFLMMMEPSKRIAPRQIVRREYIFIMDVSGSMNGLLSACSTTTS